MDIVITYDPITKNFKFYEQSADVLLESSGLAEGLVNLNNYLVSSGKMSGGEDLLNSYNINYHIDSVTFKKMVESNVKLVKRLQTGQSEFKKSNDKFGTSEKPGGFSGFKGDFSSSRFGDKNSGFRKSYKRWKE